MNNGHAGYATPTADYGAFRAKLLIRILEAKPTPSQVAHALRLNQGKYPQIGKGEIDDLEAMGEVWKPLPSRAIPKFNPSLMARWDLLE